MRFGLLVLLTLAAGSVLTHFLLEDNGYVLLNFRGYSVEMSIPILAFLLIVFYLLVRLLVRVWQAPRALGEAAARASARRTSKRTAAGLTALADGRLARGERLLTKAAASSTSPVLHYLEAARAAQMQGDHERRDTWLRMAYEQDTQGANAVLLTQAELQLAAGEREKALASLNRILEKQPRHPEALRSLAALRHEDQDWPALADLLPALRKLPSLPKSQLETWTIASGVGLLSEAEIDRSGIERCWQTLPRSLRKDPGLLGARLDALARVGASKEAEAEIRKALRATWDQRLVQLYGELELPDASKQLGRLEGWLKTHPDDAVLLLAAGKACVRNKLWGKARSYFESSLAARPTPEGYGELGQLMLKLGEDAAATEAFRQGLNLGEGRDTGLPRLQADPPLATATAASND